MQHGHVTGTKRETHGASDWYKAIEAANIQAVDDTERALVTALATQVGNAVTAMPEAATRIAKAASIVQAKDVWPLTDGTWLVGSSSDTVKAYLVQRGPWACDCADHQHRGHHLQAHCRGAAHHQAGRAVYAQLQLRSPPWYP